METTREVFSQQDKALHQGLVQLLNNGKFELSAKDVGVFQAVCKWVNGLPQKFEGVEFKAQDVPQKPEEDPKK